MISSLSFKLVFNFCLQSVMNGMHVIYVPPSVLKNSPAMWLQMVTKHRGMRQSKWHLFKFAKTMWEEFFKFSFFMSTATCALVSSRDLHWSLHASKDVKDINLSTIRMLLLADRANPCELTSVMNEHIASIMYLFIDFHRSQNLMRFSWSFSRVFVSLWLFFKCFWG